jgi:hypothetical protein
MNIEVQKSQLEEMLKILAGFLAPEQLKSYQEEQTEQINKMAAAIKMLYSPKPAEAGLF